MSPAPLELDFRFVHEPTPGPAWLGLFQEFWPAYKRWYYGSSGGAGTRPDYATCFRMLHSHLPAMVPVVEQLAELAGGGDDVARFLTLYSPPPSIRGCTQVVWRHEGELALVRNYDFTPRLCDGVVLFSAWSGIDVIAMTDCLVGALDGMNEDGLVASLAFGGDRAVAPGFGTALLVRAVLESCATVKDAAAMLRHVPVHMAYTLTILDRGGDHATVHLRPGHPARSTTDVVATNHQDGILWPKYAQFSQTVERRRHVERLLESTEEDRPSDAMALAGRFLEPPLYRRAYDRGSGTIYTTLYRPREGTLDLLWPDAHRKVGFQSFSGDVHLARYEQQAESEEGSSGLKKAGHCDE